MSIRKILCVGATTVDKVAKDYRDNDQAPPHIRVATWSKSITIEAK